MNINKLKGIFRGYLHRKKEVKLYNLYVFQKFRGNDKLIEYFLKK